MKNRTHTTIGLLAIAGCFLCGALQVSASVPEPSAPALDPKCIDLTYQLLEAWPNRTGIGSVLTD